MERVQVPRFNISVPIFPSIWKLTLSEISPWATPTATSITITNSEPDTH